MLTRLDKSQMTFRQKGFLARQGTQDANAKLINCMTHQGTVALAGDAIEDDAGNADVGIVRQESPYHGRGGWCLPGNIEDQHHRQSVSRGEGRRSAGPTPGTSRAVDP